jgi:hypothetical protein
MYAELLLHVRTITLFASLRSHHSHETTAKLSTDGTCITVTHEGRTASIRMPFEVKGGGDAEMTLPSEPPNKDITMRLQLEELEDSDVLGTLQSEERKVNVVPWDGAWLDKQSDVELQCKSCRGIVVPADKITQWRDLPNENWAEMMDFWHCHKPDEHHLHDHTHENAIDGKGYAAGNRLKATKGLGFVDLTSFLLDEGDCEGAQVRRLSSRITYPDLSQVCIGPKRKRSSLFQWHYRRYNRPRANCLCTRTLGIGRILFLGSMDRRCCRVCGLTFDCLLALRLLGPTASSPSYIYSTLSFLCDACLVLLQSLTLLRPQYMIKRKKLSSYASIATPR